MYKHLGNLTRHQKYECGKVAEFQCPFCSYKCHRKDVLKVHLMNTRKHQNIDLDSIVLWSCEILVSMIKCYWNNINSIKWN